MRQTYEQTPFVSLNTSVLGAGDEIGFVHRAGRLAPSVYAAQLEWGGATAGQIDIEGSLDGVSWFVLATDNTFTDKIIFIVDKPVSYLRGNLVALTGGTGATVTLYAE